MINFYYNRSSRVWIAYYSDSIGQLGDAVDGLTQTDAVFKLGCEMGRHPEKFARDIGEYIPAYLTEIKA
jgi:hypothetical protein